MSGFIKRVEGQVVQSRHQSSTSSMLFPTRVAVIIGSTLPWLQCCKLSSSTCNPRTGLIPHSVRTPCWHPQRAIQREHPRIKLRPQKPAQHNRGPTLPRRRRQRRRDVDTTDSHVLCADLQCGPPLNPRSAGARHRWRGRRVGLRVSDAGRDRGLPRCGGAAHRGGLYDRGRCVGHCSDGGEPVGRVVGYEDCAAASDSG